MDADQQGVGLKERIWEKSKENDWPKINENKT